MWTSSARDLLGAIMAAMVVACATREESVAQQQSPPLVHCPLLPSLYEAHFVPGEARYVDADIAAAVVARSRICTIEPVTINLYGRASTTELSVRRIEALRADLASQGVEISRIATEICSEPGDADVLYALVHFSSRRLRTCENLARQEAD